MSTFESVVEQAAIEWLVDLGYTYVNGNDIAPDGPTPERNTWGDTILGLEGR